MTDDLGRDDASIDASAFLDWLDEMADAEGKSRDELLQSLISSYWTLDEMFRLMEQADPEADLPTTGTFGATERPETREPGRLADVEGDLTERIDDVDDRLRYLREELRGHPDRDDFEDLAASLESLSDRVTALEGDVAGGRHATPDDDLADRVETLRDRVDTEFGHLHTILEHLLGTAEDLDGRTARLDDKYEDVAGFVSSHERLSRLKRTAAQLDANKAKCGYCGTKIGIALLPTPECPQCDRTFVDIEPKEGWFGSATLVVEDGRRERPGGGAHRGDGRGSEPGGPDGAGSGGFEWVGGDD